MTRINTNVSSLVAQKTLARSNTQLQEALTRLSTGLRINVGKDDPAGLIASEALRSDIISVEKAITNSERASQLIATADSALGQVSQLLNDVRGLVSEAANTGALSSEQIAASQLQVDSSLEAIDRIAQITSFQGRTLLDGTLDFITSNVDGSKIENLKIDQANFGNLSEISVNVEVVAQATRGQLNYGFSAVNEAVVLEVGGSNGTEVFNFAAGASLSDLANSVNLVSDATGVRANLAEGATKGSLLISSLGLDNDIKLEANDAGFDAGNVRVKFTEGNTAATTVNFTASNGTSPATLDVDLRMVAAAQATADIKGDDGTKTAASYELDQGGANDAILFTATSAGVRGNNIRVQVIDDGSVAAGSESASFNEASGLLTIVADSGNSTANQIIAAVNQDANVSQFITADLGTSDANNTGATAVASMASPTFLTGGVGDDNNTLSVTAKHSGTAFNGNAVQFVNGDATALGITSVDSKAAFSQAFGAAGGDLVLTARDGGVHGNAITVTYTKSDAGGSSESITSVNGNAITINLDTDAGNANANETTLQDVLDLINNDSAASALVSASLSSGATPGTKIAVLSTPGTDTLAGGGGTTNNNQERIEYEATGKKAQASFADTGTNDDLIIRATSVGTAFNNVQINITKDLTAGTDPYDAEATYDSTNKILSIRTNSDSSTTAQDIIDALSGADGSSGVAEFEAILDTSVDSTNDGTGGIAQATATNVANTNNTGGDAGTLFVYIEEGVTTANGIIERLANSANIRAAELFTMAGAQGSDGSGVMYTTTYATGLANGVDGGAVAADAEEVVAAINANTTANALLTATLTAALVTGDDGKEVATAAFQESALYGSQLASNQLQFLGGANAASVRFVNAGVSQTLGIQDNRSFATMTRQGSNANASLVFTAKQEGGDYDGVRVVLVHDDDISGGGDETVTYNQDDKILKFLINADVTTGTDIKTALAADNLASQFFQASDFGTSNGTGIVDADLRQSYSTLTFDAGTFNAGGTGADQIRIAYDTFGTTGNVVEIEITDTNGSGGETTMAFNSTTGTLSVGMDVTAGTTLTQLTAEINARFGGQFTATVLAGGGNDIDTVTTTQGAFAGGLGTDSDGDAIPDAVPATDVVTDGGLADTLIINLGTDADGLVTSTANDLASLFDDTANATLLNEFGISVSGVSPSTGAGLLTATTTDIDLARTGITFSDAQATGTSTAVNGVNAQITLVADQPGAAFGGVTLNLVADITVTKGNETVVYDATAKTITVLIDDGNTTAGDVISAINDTTTGIGDLFTAANATSGDGTGVVTTTDTLTLSTGIAESGTDAGADFIGNSDAAATGVTFVSTAYGTDGFVSIQALEGNFALTDSSASAATRSTGSNVNARINGIQAVGKGLTASLNTTGVDLSFSVSSTMADGNTTSFSIVGGGAQFQLGPDVVSNQQARLGIRAVNTARLGGVSGKLFQLRSGGSKGLDVDSSGAAAIVEEAITEVTKLRGRLGAFQKTTIESNIFSLNDTLANLTEAESSIRDADFAAESAKLTRAQILVQSGTSVLGIANSNPQNVLALLR